jgi:hypothetical protein
MPDGVQFDFSDIQKLAADLGDVPKDAGKRIRQATEISARKVKDAWKEKLKGTEDVPHGAYTITYDLDAKPGQDASTITAEIGSERGRAQAPIVTVIEFGAPGQNLAPRGYGAAALQETQADFVHGLEIAIGDPLK